MRDKKYVIPVFIPHLGCPNDCSFCNQRAITARQSPITPQDVTKEIETYLAYCHTRPQGAELAFYGGSFTGIGEDRMRAYLERAIPYLESGVIESIRVSTRPDYIDNEILNLLWEYGVRTIELGAQSMVDEILMDNDRGHTSQDTRRAVEVIRGRGFRLGIQMMLGLYAAKREDEMKSAREILKLSPDFVRIYPTLVLKGTKLEGLLIDGDYEPLSLHETIDLLVEIVPCFESAGIPIIRLGLYESGEQPLDVAGGPRHPAIRQLVYSQLYFDMLRDSLLKQELSESLCITAGDEELSYLVGHRGENRKRLRECFGFTSIRFNRDPSGKWICLQSGEEKWTLDFWSYMRKRGRVETKETGNTWV